MRERPRLLFLAYYFPPVGVIGAVRMRYMAKYLSRLGWQVTVVTPDPSLFVFVDRTERAVEELKKDRIERILTGHRWRFLTEGQGRLQYGDRGLRRLVSGCCRKLSRRLAVDPAIGWNAPAERVCRHFRPGDVDLVLASGKPFSAFELARCVSARLGCPYVLDYRDPWTVGAPHPIEQHPVPTRAMRKERQLLDACAAAMIVCPSYAEAITEAFGIGRKMHVVPNGFDPEDLQGVAAHDFGHFAIVYTGIFYPPRRTVAPLMAALKRLLDCGQALPPWRFHYYGTQDTYVRDAARQAGVESQVMIHGQVERQQVLSAIKGAGVAAVVTSVAETATLEDRGILTGKIFEPIGLGTTTLLIAPPGSDAETIIEAAGNGRRCTANDVDGMVNFLCDATRGIVPPARDPAAYAWPNIATRLDRILTQAVTEERCATACH
jgi:glycosyltransferase involved in cell wall biosynthesis